MVHQEGPDAALEKYTDYELWVRRLYATNMFHPVKMGLDNIEALHDALGAPMDGSTDDDDDDGAKKGVVVAHVAGTNGKGSVALKIARTLKLGNPDLTVGLFCSPHVSCFRERMLVNDSELITEAEVVAILPRIYQICHDLDIPATFFEITTALAFAFFASRKADVVVLETGLGGRLDATNVVKSPALSVITSIGLEHTRILGDTVELIALEKGGIIKPGRPVLVGPNAPHDVLRQCAKDKGASAYYTCDDVLGGATVKDGNDYDIENARISAAALTLLQASHPKLVPGGISQEIMEVGTSQRPPCRFEQVNYNNGQLTVILDVAHNPPAMDYLVRKLRATYPDRPGRVVVGMSSDKDLSLCCRSILEAVEQDASRIHVVEAAHPRAAKLEAILEAFPSNLANSVQCDLEDRSITSQVEKAIQRATEQSEVLVVCGSVFLMAEAREALGFEEPRDSDVIAELAGSGVRYAQENFGNTKI
jgi:dihydrofolate synthase / folylpolyglutamate synthase